ncbi:MAG: hypothetical protein ABFC54_11515 [Thermoguttaceae bacterium]
MNKHQNLAATGCVLCLLSLATWLGCGSSDSSTSKSATMTDSESASPAPKTPPPPPPPPPSEASKETPKDASQETPAKTSTKAAVGVGAKGRYDTSGPASVITVPVASLFSTKERLAFEIQIPQAMNLFKASEGRAPKSHEEFMERIIKEQRIQLPELPEGERYRYDPKSEQLMVDRPAP